MKKLVAVMALMGLAGCVQPWMTPGTAYVQVDGPRGAPLSAPMVDGKYGAHAPHTRHHATGPVADNPVRYRGPNDQRYTREELEAMPGGSFVLYREAGTCTTPNTAYAMHAMAGRYECGVLYSPQAWEHGDSGYRRVIFRDELGSAYAPNQYGVWERASRYDMFRD